MEEITIPDETYALHRELIDRLASKVTAHDELAWYLRVEAPTGNMVEIKRALGLGGES